jgi:uncharacterized protein YjiS (DUF1127 family)
MKLFATLFRLSERRRAYTQLSQLDDHLLRDMGLTRAELKAMMSGRSRGNRTDG